MPQCASPTQDVLKGTLTLLARWVRNQRDLALAIESKVPQIAAFKSIMDPLLRAEEGLRVWRGKRATELDAIAKTFGMDEAENVLAAVLDDGAGNFYNITANQRNAARKLRSHMEDVLGDAGLSREQAKRFITEDITALRAVNGDITRMSPNEIYPENFRPLMEELMANGLGVNQNNGYALAHDLLNMVGRQRFLNPAATQAKAVIADWRASAGRGGSLAGQVPARDLELAAQWGDDVVNSIQQQHSDLAQATAQMFSTVRNKFRNILGKEEVAAWDDQTIARMAANMATWYGGSAMSGRMALPLRNLTQSMLSAPKVGYGRVFRAYKDIYGGAERENIVNRAMKDLGLPAQGNSPVILNEAADDAFFASPIFRGIKRLQDQGMRPFRWSDKNNRFVTYRAGELAILEEAPALLSGKLPWESFLFNTGLKGSPLATQRAIKSLLMGTESPNVQQAARDYGRHLVADTQFLYGSLNSPLAFKGTFGRLFGQFGTWPVSFGEYMYQNVAGNGFDAAWAAKYGGNYAISKLALLGTGAALGVDVSSYNYANPLTFQGGPWYQLLRDTSVLATSVNEFERRKAFANFRRTTGILGPLHTGLFNPFGQATGDILQGIAADDPLRATMLTMGFNVRDNTLATSR